jgi:hypothetical protein
MGFLELANYVGNGGEAIAKELFKLIIVLDVQVQHNPFYSCKVPPSA